MVGGVKTVDGGLFGLHADRGLFAYDPDATDLDGNPLAGAGGESPLSSSLMARDAPLWGARTFCSGGFLYGCYADGRRGASDCQSLGGQHLLCNGGLLAEYPLHECGLTALDSPGVASSCLGRLA